MWVASPWRFALWGAGMIIDLVTPLTARRIQATPPLDTAPPCPPPIAGWSPAPWPPPSSSMAIIDLATRGEASAIPSGRRALVRLAGGAAATLVGLLAGGLPPPAVIACLTAVGAALVSVDLLLRRQTL